MKLQMEEMKNDVCRTMSEWTESLETRKLKQIPRKMRSLKVKKRKQKNR